MSDDETSSLYDAQKVDAFSLITHELSFVWVKVSLAFFLACLLIFSYRPKRLNPRKTTFLLGRRNRRKKEVIGSLDAFYTTDQYEGKREALTSSLDASDTTKQYEGKKEGQTSSLGALHKRLNPRNITSFLFGRKKNGKKEVPTSTLDASYTNEPYEVEKEVPTSTLDASYTTDQHEGRNKVLASSLDAFYTTDHLYGESSS